MSRKSKIKIIAAGAIIATCLVGVLVMTRAEDTVAHPTAETTDPTVDPTIDPTVTPTATPTPTPVPTYAPIRPVKVTSPVEVKNNEPEELLHATNTNNNTANANGEDLNGTNGEGDSAVNAESDEGTDNNAEDYSGEPENIEYYPGTDEGNNQEQTIEEEPVVEEEITEETVEYSEPEATETVSEDTGDGWEYYCNARITHYDSCEACCGIWAYGPTAWGTMPEAGRTVATGEDIPFGTEIMIDGQVYVVEDRGVPSGCVDIYVDTHDEALAKGMYYTEAYVKW